MALVLKDRVKELTSTTGTGAVTLGGPIAGFQGFSSIGDSNLTYYTIVDTDTGAWEVGYGTYTSSGSTLSRDFVYASSNANALVDFGAGTKEVFVTYPAEQAIYQETNGSLKLVGGTIGLTQDGTEGTTLPNTSFQAFTTGNYYMQANQQNLSSGAEASSDWVATADNGTDTEFYMDMGMASSGYNFPGFSAFKANSGYILSTGADLRIVAGKYGAVTPGPQDIVLVAGSLLDTEERMRIKGDTGNIILDGVNPTDTGEKLQVVGSAKITGATTFGSTVTLNANPVGNLEAATKQYVDMAAATGFTVHDAVRLTTAAALPANTYNNGVAGVGATLTAVANGALSVDGVAVVVADRVLIINEAAPANNGSYSVTATGSVGTPYILTRTTDFDQAVAGEITNNAYFFTTEGATHAGSAFILSQTAVIVVGTTALPFTLFADQLNYVGGTNIDVTGLTISLTGTVAPSNGGTGINSYANGDTIYASGAATFSKLPIGTTGQTMIVAGGFPAWGALNLAGAGVSGVLAEIHGGTNQGSYAIGDLLYSSATNTLAKLAGNTTTAKQYLSQTGTGSASAAPSWAAVAAADITGLAPSATIDTTNAANITTGALPSGRLVGGYTGVTAVGTLAGLDVSGTAVIAANSATDALRITQLGAGNALVVEDSGSPDATPFIVDFAGGVIQGNATFLPTDNYAGNSMVPNFQKHGGAISSASIASTLWNSGSGSNAGGLVLSRSKSATIGTNASVVANDTLGTVSFNGDDGTSFISSAYISGAVDGTPGTDVMPGRLVFATTPAGASAPTERMRIDSAGQVSIGTSAAAAGTTFRLSKNITGAATAQAVNANGAIQSDVTGGAQIFRSSPSTQATTFTLGSLDHFQVNPQAFGAGSTVTNQYGFNAASSLTGATNNYGFYGNIPAGTGRYNLYMAGTAENYLGGNTVINVNDNTNAALRITQLGTGNALLVEDSANPDSSPFVIDSSGNVGIGTSLPSNLLNIQTAATGTTVTSNIIAKFQSNGTGRDATIQLSDNVTNSATISMLGGATIFSQNGVERSRISSAGGFSVGTTADPGAGAIFATGNVTAFYSSDRRLKENVRDIPNALDKVSAIGGKNFDWTDEYIAEHGGANDYFLRKADFGVIAQDVEAVFPEAVRTRDNGMLAVDYEKLCALAFAAISELRKEVEELKKGK